MRVLKFGGSSIATPERIEAVLEIIETSRRQDEIIVVVSAFGGVTNKLIETCNLAAAGDEKYLDRLKELQRTHITAAKALAGAKHRPMLTRVQQKLEHLGDVLHGVFLLRELSLRSLDLIMSFGERLSAFIISQSLDARTGGVAYLRASDLIRTDDRFGSARVDFETTNRNLAQYFAQHHDLQVVTGFIAATGKGEITTLGRSGSDYTAAILAAALDADEVEIWTDVDGVMTADPRLVRAAFSIVSMSYEEAMEMSHFGSKVIHPKSMQPALEKDIPLRIRNTFNPSFAGTLICRNPEANPYVIRGISSLSDIALLRIQGSGMLGVMGISARLFGALAAAQINVILITQGSSEHSICLAVMPEKAELARRAIEEAFHLEILAHQIEEVVVERELSVIAVVGERMRGTPGIAARTFSALGKHGANVVAIAQGSSELNISIVVGRRQEATALNAIHSTFFGRDSKTLHLFLVGPGLVGGQLLKQIQQQADFLEREYALELRLNGIANSKKMRFDPDGISLANWQKRLSEASESVDLETFVGRMKSLNYHNAVFLDCTASDAPVVFYERILNLGISIVTPNKRANSGPFGQYRQLKQLAVRRDVRFFYETNVGAGLPIISTINSLLLSGDRIIKIETIISGSISYIFNTFDGSQPFSEVVKQAQERGFTEPDPREDLNGMDVARKLLILAREIGLTCELSDIELENILPQPCRSAANVAEFYAALQKHDEVFARKLEKARQADKVLRYIGAIEDGRIRVALEMISASHPFYHISGRDNIMAITSNRYAEQPLVIKGAGAGAEVTAAGVFADVIRIGTLLT